MKAIVLRHYGSPEDLRLEELPRPEPRPNEVLVKVYATSVNDWDWSYVRGRPYALRPLYGLRKPNVSILGTEVAGTVEATGDQVTKFKVGDRVYGDLSEAGFGGFAEYVSVRADALGHMPEGMTFQDAASLPHASMLALQGLVDIGQLQRGERVLINGAGGGVGTIGLQIAKQYEAEVTGVDAGFKLDDLKSLGFDHVVDYEQVDFTQAGEQYDVILDAKTTRSTLRYLRALTPGGRYTTVGGQLRRLLQTFVLGPPVARLTGKQTRVVALKTNKDLDLVSQMFSRGQLNCVIDGPYSLEDTPEAVRRFGEAKHIGKVVITVAPDESAE